jgi:hypothetical protein
MARVISKNLTTGSDELVDNGGGGGGDGSTERVLTANLKILEGRSYVVVGPLVLGGYTVTIAETGRLRIL